MLKEQFLGKVPSNFHINPIVKAFIISEAFLWSAWNFVTPIFAIFIINSIDGGNIQIAGMGFSVYLVSRVVFELISGKYLILSKDKQKFVVAIFGMLMISVAYLGFAFSRTILSLYFFYAIAGLGLGLASPAKNSLFSIHLDKNKEATEWGIADAISFICMALAAAIGGFIAQQYGFSSLFYIAAVLNLLGTIPYFLQLK